MMRVTFDEERHSAAKESKRSVIAQARRQERKCLRRLFKKMAAARNDDEQILTKEQRDVQMKLAFRRLKHPEEHARDNLLNTYIEGRERNANNDVVFRFSLESVMRAAGAGETRTMEQQLEWFRKKRGGYDVFMKRTGFGSSLSALCIQPRYLSSFPNMNLSSSDSETSVHGIEPSASRQIMREKVPEDAANIICEEYLHVARSESSETRRLDEQNSREAEEAPDGNIVETNEDEHNSPVPKKRRMN